MKQQRKWQPIPIGFIICLLLASSSIFAKDSTALLANHSRQHFWNPFITLIGGASFNSKAGQSKYFPATNEVFSYYNYHDYNIRQTDSIFGGSVGSEFLLNPKWALQGSISYYQPSTFNVKGIVTQGVDTSSENQYSYKYAIQVHQLLIESKLLYNLQYYHPYLSAGVGTAWNKSKNYTVNIQPPFTTFSNQFKDGTHASFSYSLGFGVDRNITEYVRLGVGYRFTDFGSSETGHGIIDTVRTSHALSQSHLYTNLLLAQFTVLLM